MNIEAGRLLEQPLNFREVIKRELPAIFACDQHVKIAVRFGVDAGPGAEYIKRSNAETPKLLSVCLNSGEDCLVYGSARSFHALTYNTTGIHSQKWSGKSKLASASMPWFFGYVPIRLRNRVGRQRQALTPVCLMPNGATLFDLGTEALWLIGLTLVAMTIAVTRFRRTLD